MTRAFISYVREDQEKVDEIAELLKSNGLEVWLDRTDLGGGKRWKAEIELAIRNGLFFLSVHSIARESRGATYANEELTVAIEELRRRRTDVVWLIPIRLDDCELDNRPIGGGERLADLNYIQYDDWPSGPIKLLRALGISVPIVDPKQPLGPSVGSAADIIGGYISYDSSASIPDLYSGIEFRIESGRIYRDDEEKIVLDLNLRAPSNKIQDLYRAIGADSYHIVIEGMELSTRSDSPNRFLAEKIVTIAAGKRVPSNAPDGFSRLPTSVLFDLSLSGQGYLSGRVFKGLFETSGTFKPTGSFAGPVGTVPTQRGAFEFVIGPNGSPKSQP